MGRPAGTALWEGFLDACGLLEERPMACDPCPNCREGNTAGCTKPTAIEAARQAGFAAGVEAAAKWLGVNGKGGPIRNAYLAEGVRALTRGGTAKEGR